MAFRVTLPNFSKGEIGPELIARTDVAAYSAAARLARNVFVRKYGGLSKRMGTRFVAEVHDASQPVRLIPFQFSTVQAYALEFGQGYMRVAANGGMVLEQALTIQSITLGATTTIQTAFHAYAVGDEVYLSGISGTTELNGRMVKVIAVPNANSFVVNVDSRGFGAFTADSGGITRTNDPTPPPAPPPVPDPTPAPPPPETGGGGSRCVADDTAILLPDYRTKPARDLRVGDKVLTRHEDTMDWGRFEVTSISFHEAPVFVAVIDGRALRATARHRVWVDGRWQLMKDLGVADGMARIASISVANARTYISNGILSHNIKQVQVVDN